MTPDRSPHRDRLWTPWRMRYITGGAREQGCIFCNRLSANDDVDSLILYRSDHAFVIMNLYPYNTGHVMVVPNTHESDLDALDDATLVDMARLVPRVVSALRRVLGCDGFNIGLNLGADAGAGVAEHLHQHVVPRWEGDANFMPILAGTMVIPEVIPATYAKVRADMEREIHGTRSFDIVVVSDEATPKLWLRDGTIPAIAPEEGQSVGRATLTALAIDASEIVGWSGDLMAAPGSTIRPGLLARSPGTPAGEGWSPVDPASISGIADEQTRSTLDRAWRQAYPWIAAPEPAY